MKTLKILFLKTYVVLVVMLLPNISMIILVVVVVSNAKSVNLDLIISLGSLNKSNLNVLIVVVLFLV